ncbi:hypothetical protein D3C85_1016820 [compost metagenome]
MADRHQEHESVVTIGQFVQTLSRYVIGKNADVGTPVFHCLNDGFAECFFQSDTHVRVGTQERREVIRQELDDGGSVGEQPHMPAHTDRVITGVARHTVHAFQNRSGMFNDPLSRRGQFEPPWQAHE